MCVQSVILPVQVSGQFYFIWNGDPDWETCQCCDFFMLSIIALFPDLHCSILDCLQYANKLEGGQPIQGYMHG